MPTGATSETPFQGGGALTGIWDDVVLTIWNVLSGEAESTFKEIKV